MFNAALNSGPMADMIAPSTGCGLRMRTFSITLPADNDMPCEHLKALFDLCEKHDLQISSPDAIKVVCRQCQQQEVCPSSLTDGDQVLALQPPTDRKSNHGTTAGEDRGRG